MLSRWYRALPGPPAAKVVEAILIVVVLLVLVAVAFEYLGRLLLDDGGVIG
jgi:hypothetical protein